MEDLSLVIEAALSPEDVRFLEDQLYEFNVRATGIDGGEWLAIFVRDQAQRIVAGLTGSTWGGCCEIRQLWVEASRRGQGLGARLLAAATAEAVRRQCTQMVLSTHSFQAPRFYEKYGFEVVATVDDHPHGHRQLLMRKCLSLASS